MSEPAAAGFPVGDSETYNTIWNSCEGVVDSFSLW